MRALADRIKLPVRREVLVKSTDEGMALTSVVGILFRYSTGATRMLTEGGAEREYVKT